MSNACLMLGVHLHRAFHPHHSTTPRLSFFPPRSAARFLSGGALGTDREPVPPHVDFDGGDRGAPFAKKEDFSRLIANGDVIDIPCYDEEGYREDEAKALLQELVPLARRQLFLASGHCNRQQPHDYASSTAQSSPMSIDAPTVPTVVVAFSGGVDSSLALYLAKESVGPENVKVLTSPGFASHSIPSGPLPIPRSTDQAFLQAVIGISPSLSATQHERAKHVASVLGVRLQEIATEEGSVEGYVRNEGDACYYCKTELYSRLKAVGEAVIGGAAREDKEVGRATVIVNGTNADDLRDPSRLGLVAAQEHAVASPLAQLSKRAVRAAARAAAVPSWDFAAAPCLRSRLAFGVRAERETLSLVEEAEAAVASALGLGARDSFRVRVTAPGVAMVALERETLERVRAAEVAGASSGRQRAGIGGSGGAEPSGDIQRRRQAGSSMVEGEGRGGGSRGSRASSTVERDGRGVRGEGKGYGESHGGRVHYGERGAGEGSGMQGAVWGDAAGSEDGGSMREALEDALRQIGFDSVEFGEFRSGELAGVADVLAREGGGVGTD